MIRTFVISGILLLITACGGGSSGDNTSTAPPSSRDLSVELGQDLFHNANDTIELVPQYQHDSAFPPTFQWRQTEGPSLDASPFNQKSLKFTLPSVAVETTVAFELTLTDGQGNQAQDTIRITIKPTPQPHNLPPTVQVGSPFSVEEGAFADGLSVTARDEDGQIEKIEWRQTGGPTVSLSNVNSAYPKFKAPLVDNDTDLVFSVTVTDNLGATAQDQQIVTVQDSALNQRPQVSVGEDKAVVEGTDVTLTAHATDADGNIVAYRWRQLSGPSVTLNDATQANVTFSVPTQWTQGDSIGLMVTVTDNQGGIGNARITLAITAAEHSFNAIEYLDPELKRCVDQHRTLKGWQNTLEVTELDCASSFQINTSRDLVHFTNLAKLTIKSRLFTDFSSDHVPNIESLSFQGSALKTLDFSGNKSLRSLTLVSINTLQSLALSQNFALTQLTVNGSQIADLDLSQQTTLQSLSLHMARLNQLQLANMPDLTTLKITGTQLTQFIAPSLPQLRTLNVSDNKLQTLGVTELPALTALYAGNNALTELSLANNLALTDVRVPKNPLSTLNIRPLLELERLEISETDLTTIDFSQSQKIAALLAGNSTQLHTLHGPLLPIKEIDLSHTRVTDIDFNQLQEGMVLIGASGKGLTQFNAARYPNLRTLYIADNALTSLALSHNPQLLLLDAKNNQLAQLDLSANPELADLDAAHNRLTSVQLAEGSRLSFIVLSHNQLKDVDLSPAVNVFDVEVQNNPLVNIELSGLRQLRTLDVSNSDLVDLDTPTAASFWCLRAENNRFSTQLLEQLALFDQMLGKVFLTTPMSKSTLNDECHAHL
ncbi:hypothetical protein ABRZ79_04520 [Vibrio vulnificus]|uniref:leucine-rich repeat domain-containing protein n=1 Tax=Vibrio vulnificus TaxID=672 RepID=UPI0032EF023B